MSDDPTVVTVPMRMDALLINPELFKSQVFYRSGLDFYNPFDFTDPEGRPLDHSSGEDKEEEKQERGVHLHWHIPEALGRGRVDLGGDASAGHTPAAADVTFPAVPNRWLVLRHHQTAAGQPPAVAGWLLHSDHTSPDDLGPDHPHGATSPAGPNLFLGWHTSLATAAVDAPPEDQALARLTVLGPANLAAFAAYQPYCRDVFSFHDPLTADGNDEPGTLANGTLSYLVTGWHAAAGDDLTDSANVQALLAFHGTLATTGTDPVARLAEALRLSNWTPPAGGLAATARTVYHATVLALPWNNAEHADAPNGARPAGTGQQVLVAVGHDVADATDVLIENSLPADPKDAKVTRARKAELLRAFHTGRLELADHAAQPADEPFLFQAAHHRDRFRATPAGHRWHLTNVQPAPDATRDAQLAALNQAQKHLDDALYRAQILRCRLWDAWWLAAGKDHEDGTGKNGASALTGDLKEQLAKALAAAAAAATARDDAKAAFGKAYHDTALVAVPLEPFYHASDPAVVLRGTGSPPERPLRRESDLPTRAPGQLLTALSSHDKDTTVALEAPAFDKLPRPPGLATVLDALPAVLQAAVKAMARELYVLHAAACHIQADPGADLTTLKAPDSSSQLRLTVPAEKGASLQRVLPAYTTTWCQPWTPLLLEWRLTYHPLPYDRDGSNQPPYWVFDGFRRQMDAATDTVKAAHAAPGHPLLGRSLLAPVPRFTLQRRADAYRDTYQDTGVSNLPNLLERFRDEVTHWDLQSATLGGLHAALSGRSTAALRAPLPTAAAGLLTDPQMQWPDPERWDTRQRIHATQFWLNDTVLIDTFGRSTRLIPVDDAHDAQTYHVYRAASVRPNPKTTVETQNADRFIQLPPRLAEGARLRLTARPAHADLSGGGDKEYDDERQTQDLPVVGWVVVRDSADAARMTLDLYGSDADALGTLRRIGPANVPARQAVSWRALPGSTIHTPADVHAEKFTEHGPLLAAFVRSLLDKTPDTLAADATRTTGQPTDKALRFADLADVVDLALTSTYPPPGRTVGTALAAGRLLALVHLRAHIEVDGTHGKDSDPHPDRRWPIRLGTPGDLRCGLVGYYPDADCHAFHTDHRPRQYDTDHPWPRTDYVPAIGDGATYSAQAHPRPDDPTKNAPPGAGHALVLMDPFQAIQAHTDILPTTAFQLPRTLVEQAISRLCLAVPFGPALAHTTTNGTARLTLPAPSPAGTWNLATRTGDTWQQTPLTTGGIPPVLTPTTPDARTGHLTYTPKDPATS
ncbi:MULTISPECIES: hypothetical protein [unclassified Streptomyces]|uniref:hypothetical protein n=1 Tax=unclassified Streptomyces TaxID=2593676 RepID=UPI0038154441